MKRKYAKGLSRLYEHITQGFGIVTAFRGDLPLKENVERNRELKIFARGLGYGFMELASAWRDYSTNKEEKEMALFIPLITSKDIERLGAMFDQHSVIWASQQEDDEPFIYLASTNKEDGIGKVLEVFDHTEFGFRDAWAAYTKYRGRGFSFVKKSSVSDGGFDEVVLAGSPSPKSIGLVICGYKVGLGFDGVYNRSGNPQFDGGFPGLG